MIDYDFRFWDAYYRWSMQGPVDRAMAAFRDSMISVELTISDALTPAIRKATWAFRDFAFTLWLIDQPRWLRPLMKVGYWLETRGRWLDR